MKRGLASLVIALSLVIGIPVAGDATTVTRYLGEAIRRLPVASENRSGYDRSKFNLWITWPNGCDTREQVLKNESLVPETRGGGCSATRGEWFSYYDARTWRNPSEVDIDHLVPLAEAWDSGARRWSGATRERYANDLGDSRTLVAVTDNVNQSKGDQDPAEWLPTFSRCRYVAQWVAVKTRWHLKVDRAEKAALSRVASRCGNPVMKVTLATIALSGSGGGGGGEGGNCSPSYPTVCIPPPPPDLNCGDISYRNFRVVGSDPHRFDGDHDGVGCEDARVTKAREAVS